jgi:hypothetical protein
MRKPDKNDPHVHVPNDEKNNEGLVAARKVTETKDYNTVSQDRYINPALIDMDELPSPAIPKLQKIGVTDFNSFEENGDIITSRRILGKGTVIKITEKYRNRRKSDESTDTESGIRRIGGDSYQLSHHG